MATPLYPTFQKRVNDAIENLVTQQVTPWSFMTAGPPFRVKRFDGREIVYQNVLFDGSPRVVFWGGYIDPFLEHLCVDEIGTAVTMAKERDVDGRLLLSEVRDLLVAGVKKVYTRMADVDQRLRGRGYPDRVAPRSVADKVQRMERFIDDRVQAELMMWKPSAGLLPWGRRASAILAIIPLGAIVGIMGLAYSYKTSDADELRTLIYQPLYADLVKVENSLKAVSIDELPPDKALRELRQTGAIERIPSNLKIRLVNVFGEATDTHMSALAVKEIVIREMSSRIMEIRTEETDRAWHQKTSDVLRELSLANPKKGISDQFTLVEGVTHESVGQAMDVRDPSKPIIGGPGGPIFVVRDWLGYPEIVKTIDVLWKETDFLYFNQTRFDWYYRLTREDLKRIDTSLEQYLKPVYDVLKENPDFKKLRAQRPILLADIEAIKDELTDRVRDPKQMRDLLNL